MDQTVGLPNFHHNFRKSLQGVAASLSNKLEIALKLWQNFSPRLCSFSLSHFWISCDLIDLIKEQFGISDKKIIESLKQLGVDPVDLLAEDSKWFVLEDGRLSPGSYKVNSDKVLNSTCEDIVRKKDYIVVSEDCYPVGDIFGINIYEVTHRTTKQKVYVTVDELLI